MKIMAQNHNMMKEMKVSIARIETWKRKWKEIWRKKKICNEINEK